MAALEQELRTDFHKSLAGLLATARTRLEGALAEVAEERAQGLAEVAKQKAELRREIEAMQTHTEQQQGHVELNIGGYRFETSVQTLRRIPHTFFSRFQSPPSSLQHWNPFSGGCDLAENRVRWVQTG